MKNSTEKPLLTRDDVKKMLGVKSQQTVYTYMELHGFPKPIQIGLRSKRWIAEEVESWIQTRIEASRNEAHKLA